MDSLVPAASRIIAAILDPVAGIAGNAGPLAGMALLSAPAGVLMAEAFRLASPRNLGSLLRSALSRMAGMMLHVEDPVTVVKLAFSSLWRTVVLLAALVPPILLASLPFSAAYGQIRARYGLAFPRDNAVVTIDSDSAVQVAGEGVVPPVVRGVSPGTASFRIAGVGRGTLMVDGVPIDTGSGEPGMPLVSRFTTARTPSALLDPSIRIVEGSANRFDGRISLGQASYEMAGIRAGWLAWFVIFSSVAATAWFALVSALKSARRFRPCSPAP
ncbi:MAG: hypothetical protein QUS11_02350 [Candidatus Fermentibacter sp.]|nr:hypothetical protein [Candidatus Fermentibacter sp.]